MNSFYTEGQDPLDPAAVGLNISIIRNNRKVSQANNLTKLSIGRSTNNKNDNKSGNRSLSSQVQSPSPLNSNALRYARKNFQKYQQHLESNNINIPLAPPAYKSSIQELQLIDGINSTSNKQNYQHMQNIASIYTPLNSKAVKRRMMTPNQSQLKRRISSECGREELQSPHRDDGSIVLQPLQENSTSIQQSTNNQKQTQQSTGSTNVPSSSCSNNSVKGGVNNNSTNQSIIFPHQNKRNSTSLRKPFISNQNSGLNSIPNKSIDRQLEKFNADLPTLSTPSNLIQDRTNFSSSICTPQGKSTFIQERSKQGIGIQKILDIQLGLSPSVKGGSTRANLMKSRAAQLHQLDRKNISNIQEGQLNEDSQDHGSIQINQDDILAHQNIVPLKIQARLQQEQFKQVLQTPENNKSQGEGQINSFNRGVQSIINNIQNITIKNQLVNYNINTPSTISQRESHHKYASSQQSHNYSNNSRSINQSSLATRANSPFQRGANIKLKAKIKFQCGQISNVKGRVSGERSPQGSPNSSQNNLNLNSSFLHKNLGEGYGKKLYISTQPDDLEEDSKEMIKQNRNSSVRNQKNNVNNYLSSFVKERHLTVHNDSEEMLQDNKKPRYANINKVRQQIDNLKPRNEIHSSQVVQNMNIEIKQKVLQDRGKDEQQCLPSNQELKVQILNESIVKSQLNNNSNFNQQQQQQNLKERKSKKERYSEQETNQNCKENIQTLEEKKEKQSDSTIEDRSQNLSTISIKKQDNEEQIHPKTKWDLSDEEWNTFGDRFPKTLFKKKLLGRGGFSLVWLGEEKESKENYAVKQIQSRNTHQTHIKEIWFGSFFFKHGLPKEKYLHYRGIQNLSKMMHYDIKPVDTWIYYELCGQSLGSSLYELKGEGYKGEERIYRVHYKKLYLSMQKDLISFKKLVFELAQALWLLSDQRIVHSDLKTENILVKTCETEKGLQIEQVKLIDFGSSFTFGNLKHFSMATPEYMAPEILNFILFQNQLRHLPQLLECLKTYTKTYVIDIWSLGCVMMEIISGIPLWMSLQTIVTHKGQELIRQGLFAAKGRVFENIIDKQIEVVSKIDYYINEHNYSGIIIDNDLRYLVKRMLTLDPDQRISPKEVCQFLHRQILGTDFIDIPSPLPQEDRDEKTSSKKEEQNFENQVKK